MKLWKNGQSGTHMLMHVSHMPLQSMNDPGVLRGRREDLEKWAAVSSFHTFTRADERGCEIKRRRISSRTLEGRGWRHQVRIVCDWCARSCTHGVIYTAISQPRYFRNMQNQTFSFIIICAFVDELPVRDSELRDCLSLSHTISCYFSYFRNSDPEHATLPHWLTRRSVLG